MAISEKALENVLDKLSGIRATMNNDERYALDWILLRSQPGEGGAEVEAHAMDVAQVDTGAADVGRFDVFAAEVGSIRLKDDAYAIFPTAR